MATTDKIKIKIGIIGYLPFNFNEKRIENLNSPEFEIIGSINKLKHFKGKADIEIDKILSVNNEKKNNLFGYSDIVLEEELIKNSTNADFYIWITYVPLQDNYFVRRLNSNLVVLSYFQMYDLLKKELIPVESLLLRTIYRHILIYWKYDKSIPSHIKVPKMPFIHDDTRGCMFDACGNKADVIFFLNDPNICEECIREIEYIGTFRVGDNHVSQIKKEFAKIKKGRYYKIVAFIKKMPIISLILSALLGISLNLIATAIWDTVHETPTSRICDDRN